MSISNWSHPSITRRTALEAGAVTLLGLGMGEASALRALANSSKNAGGVIYIFLSGGLAQQDSFDLKPQAPADIRGEFKPIPTRTPGIQICEHLPMLAERSSMWALCRSLTHPTNNHSDGHLMMLTGRSVLPPGFSPNRPQPSDWPSIAALAGALTPKRNNLPPAAVLPDRIVHNTGRVIPGQFAGEMGQHRDPWFIEASPFDPKAYGAFPQYEFDHQQRPHTPFRKMFTLPHLSLPEGLGQDRLGDRLHLLRHVDLQRANLDRAGSDFDRHRQEALVLLTDAKTRKVFDLADVKPEVLERYGNNSFGWSLLMSRRLIEAGVNFVQVNLGNNETWDTHGNAFPHLKNYLFPPTDRAVSALLDDLQATGLLESTLIVMAGEFGRTPRVFGLPQHYKLPGRDHWGAVQTVFFAGAGVRGGTVIGSSDKQGGYPATDPQTPENLAATIYESLGLPRSILWHDPSQRPHHVYHGDPIRGLMG